MFPVSLAARLGTGTAGAYSNLATAQSGNVLGLRGLPLVSVGSCIPGHTVLVPSLAARVTVIHAFLEGPQLVSIRKRDDSVGRFADGRYQHSGIRSGRVGIS